MKTFSLTKTISTLLLILIFNHIYCQAPVANCYFAQFFDYSYTQVLLTDLNPNGTNCSGLYEQQSRPIYDCDTLLLKLGNGANGGGYVNCGAIATATATVQIYQGNTLITSYILGNMASGTPPDCEFQFIAPVGLPSGSYRVVVLFGTQMYADGNFDYINTQEFNFVQSITFTNDCPNLPYEVCLNFDMALSEDELSVVTVNFGDGSPPESPCWWSGTQWNCDYTLCHTYSAYGNYSISFVPDSFPCPMADTVISLVPITVQLTPDVYTGCNTDTAFTITSTVSNATPEYTYQWSVPTADGLPYGISSLTSSSVTFSPFNATMGQYTVTVTDANGCTASASFTNDMIYCCSGYNRFTAHNVTYNNVSATWLNANGYLVNNYVLDCQNVPPADLRMVFNGTLTIDHDFTIINSPGMEFGAAARVVIENGATLKIHNSILGACDTMLWSGIEVSEAGSVSIGGTNRFGLIVTQSYITEAMIAVSCTNSGRVSIDQTGFINNFVGVQLNQANNSLSRIERSNFYSIAPHLLASWPGANFVVTPGTRGATGLFISASQPVNLGAENLGNHFYDINNGILNLNTTLTSVHSRFSNISSYNAVPSPFSLANHYGIAAYDMNGAGVQSQFTLTVQGTGKNATNLSFSQTLLGIYVREMNCNIYNNRFQVNNANSMGLSRGIVTEFCQFDNVTVSNNTLTYYRFGIDLLQNRLATQDVTSNNIVVTDPQGQLANTYSGITLTYGQLADNLFTRIAYNKILHGRYGITCSNVGAGGGASFLDINDNEIEKGNSGFYGTSNPFIPTGSNQYMHGIHLHNCIGDNQSLRVFNNTVYGSHPNRANYASFRLQALTLSESRGANLYCNTTYNTGVGLMALGDCNGTNLQSNCFGIVSNTGTVWPHQYSVVYRKTAIADGNIGQQGNASTCLRNAFQPTATGFGSNAKVFQVYNLLPHDPIFDFGTGLFQLNYPIEYGNFNSINAQDQLATQLASPICGSGNNMMLMAEGNTTANDLEQKAEELQSGEAAEQFEYEFVEGGVWFKERDLYRQLLRDSSLIETGTEREQFFAERTNESTGKYEGLEKEMETMKEIADPTDTASVYAQARHLKALNAQMPNSRNIEYNEKWINELDFEHIEKANTSFTQEQAAMLQQLAYTCPLIGGKAVYKARAYYLLIDREADFEDLSLCLSSSYKAEQQAAESSANTSPVWKVQPNPANEGLYVFYEQPINGGTQVLLQATDGRLLRQQTIADEGSSIVYVNTTELPDGIYLLRVTQNSEHVYQTKVVVKH